LDLPDLGSQATGYQEEIVSVKSERQEQVDLSNKLLHSIYG
jgi:hypothetical protein